MSKIIKHQYANLKDASAKEIKVKYFDIVHPDKEPIPSIDMENQVRAILDNANSEAQRLIQAAQIEKNSALEEIENQRLKWEAEKKELQEKAFQEGFESGQAAGRVDGYTEYLEAIDEAGEVIEQAKISFKNQIEQAEKVILDLAISVAEKILHEQVGTKPDAFLSLVKNAVKEAREYKEVQIHVHPSKYGLLVDAEDEIKSIFPHEVQCYLYPNPDLGETDCFIESENGKIDASIDTQLGEVKKTLFELLGEYV